MNFGDTFNVSPTCYRGYIIRRIVIRLWGRGNGISREDKIGKRQDDQGGPDDPDGLFMDDIILAAWR